MTHFGSWQRIAWLGAAVAVAAVVLLVTQRTADTRRQVRESEEEIWSI